MTFTIVTKEVGTLDDKIVITSRKQRRSFMVRLPEDLDDKIELLARQTGRTKTDLTVMAFEELLKRAEVRR